MSRRRLSAAHMLLIETKSFIEGSGICDDRYQSITGIRDAIVCKLQRQLLGVIESLIFYHTSWERAIVLALSNILSHLYLCPLANTVDWRHSVSIIHN